MKLSIRDLALSGLFIIIASTVVSNLYRPKWGIIYAVVNLIVLTFISLIKDSWSINKNNWQRVKESTEWKWKNLRTITSLKNLKLLADL